MQSINLYDIKEYTNESIQSTDDPMIILGSIIQNLKKELQEYTKRLDAKNGYIKKQSLLIEELDAIYAAINGIHLPFWISLENILKNLSDRDKQLSGHKIMLRIKPEGNNFSMISLNRF